MTLSDQIERQLCERRVEGLPDHFVLPYYDGHSIASLAPTVAQMMGVDWGDAAPAFPDALWSDLADDVRCVVLLILDAVGCRQLSRYLNAERSLFGRLVRRGRLVPITSVFPSTTVSALTSIWTGIPPLGHGFLGTKLLLPKQGVLANMLKLAPAMQRGGGDLADWGWDHAEFVNAPRLAERLSAAGIRTVAHTRRAFIGSSLTQIFLHGIEELRGYVGLSDLWLSLRRTLVERDLDRPLFVDVYWGGADNVGHVYGPEDDYGAATLRLVARSLEEDLLDRLPARAVDRTLLIITADHGQIATPPEHVVRLPEHPDLWDTLLLPPAGESRAAYLYAKPGQKERLRAYVRDHLDDRFVLWDTEDALAAGLWGLPRDVTPDLRARLGDVVLISRDRARLSTRKEEDDKIPLRGHHGGLTAEEMLVPLLMARLDDL